MFHSIVFGSVLIMAKEKNSIAIFGSGLRARELQFLLESEKGIKANYYVVDGQYVETKRIGDCEVLATEQFIKDFEPTQTKVYLGVGMPSMNRIRERLFRQFHNSGFIFEKFISEKANVYTTKIGEGTTIFAGVNIGPNVEIGAGNHFEMGVTISHDCKIGNFNFFAPGCVLCGDITIGTGSFIGSNSTIRNSVTIGDYALIGAGAYVDKNINSEKVVVPARSIVLNERTSKDFMR